MGAGLRPRPIFLHVPDVCGVVHEANLLLGLVGAGRLAHPARSITASFQHGTADQDGPQAWLGGRLDVGPGHCLLLGLRRHLTHGGADPFQYCIPGLPPFLPDGILGILHVPYREGAVGGEPPGHGILQGVLPVEGSRLLGVFKGHGQPQGVEAVQTPGVGVQGSVQLRSRVRLSTHDRERAVSTSTSRAGTSSWPSRARGKRRSDSSDMAAFNGRSSQVSSGVRGMSQRCEGPGPASCLWRKLKAPPQTNQCRRYDSGISVRKVPHGRK
jgi:hypothetical protein